MWHHWWPRRDTHGPPLLHTMTINPLPVVLSPDFISGKPFHRGRSSAPRRGRWVAEPHKSQRSSNCNSPFIRKVIHFPNICQRGCRYHGNYTRRSCVRAGLRAFCWTWALQGPKSSINVPTARQVRGEVCDLIRIKSAHVVYMDTLFHQSISLRAGLRFPLVWLYPSIYLSLTSTFKCMNVRIVLGK